MVPRGQGSSGYAGVMKECVCGFVCHEEDLDADREHYRSGLHSHNIDRRLHFWKENERLRREKQNEDKTEGK